MWERSIDRLPLVSALTWDQTHNPGMWPDWELKMVTFYFAGQCPINWAMPVRARQIFWSFTVNKSREMRQSLEWCVGANEGIYGRMWEMITNLPQKFALVAEITCPYSHVFLGIIASNSHRCCILRKLSLQQVWLEQTLRKPMDSL